MAGKAWDRSKIGRRVSVTPLGEDVDASIADPARGERVTRCDECGLPDLGGNRVIAGTWTVGGLSFTYRLCEREIRRRSPFDPRSGDPLTVLS